MNINRREFLTGLGVSAAALGLSTLIACNKKNDSATTKSFDLVHGNDPALYPIYEDGKYIKKDFSSLTELANLGLSSEMITAHLALYEGYIAKVNQAEDEMRANNINEFSLKNLAFSLNGMALHDIYFSNMNVNGGKRSQILDQMINDTYGNFETYFANLSAIATQVSGWSLTCLNLLNGKLFNYGTEDHSANFPNFVIPILALDVYEHAYLIDFGKEGKDKYLETLTRIIDWDLVSRRLDALRLIYS